MAEKNAQAFWTQVRDDSQFRDRLTSATTDQDHSSPIAVVALSASCGRFLSGM